MKRVLIALTLLTCSLASFAGGDKDKKGTNGYTLKFKVNGFRDTLAYLGNHYADKQYVIDTARMDKAGNVTFNGKKKLDGGIYLFITPDKKYFEVLIDGKEDNFYIETDSTDYIANMKIKGSPENQYYNDYQKFLGTKGKQAEYLRRMVDKHKANKDSAKIYQDKLAEMDKEVKNYKLDFMKSHPESFLTKILKTTQPPDVPEAPILPNGRKDSTFAYRYYKAHFFDNIDFADNRLLRTPIIYGKYKEYFEQLTYQIPDSINASADLLVEKSRADKEFFKYTVVYITSTYERSNIMGMDAVFVHMSKNYYTYDQATWVDSTTIFKIQDRAKRTEPLLVGKKAPLFVCKDTSGKYVNLYQVKSKYTVLVFWDPDCGHCKKSMPFIIDAYDKLRPYGIEIVAACTEVEKDKWLKFIREHKLKWINVADPDLQSNFRYDYYIESTPQIYILDENKKIIAKKLAAEQLYDFFSKSLKVAPVIETPPKLDDRSEKDKVNKDIH